MDLFDSKTLLCIGITVVGLIAVGFWLNSKINTIEATFVEKNTQIENALVQQMKILQHIVTNNPSLMGQQPQQQPPQKTHNHPRQQQQPPPPQDEEMPGEEFDEEINNELTK